MHTAIPWVYSRRAACTKMSNWSAVGDVGVWAGVAIQYVISFLYNSVGTKKRLLASE